MQDFPYAFIFSLRNGTINNFFFFFLQKIILKTKFWDKSKMKMLHMHKKTSAF